MKNQYFGNINDYRKYGLLRILSDNGKLRVGICWMLTAPDGRTDGKFRTYLDHPKRYRFFDPPLFDALLPCRTDLLSRNVAVAEAAGIIPDGIYYPAVLTDKTSSRAKYFSDFASLSRDCDLVFFDPDNGLEVGSVRKGCKGSCKYLYWDELQQVYETGKSVLVYQHFCRIKRDVFIRDLTERACNKLGASCIITFRTPHVLFMLIPRPSHYDMLTRRSKLVADMWQSQIVVNQELTLGPLMHFMQVHKNNPLIRSSRWTLT